MNSEPLSADDGDFPPVVRPREYEVNSYPPGGPNARCFLIRVIRFEDELGEWWGVFDFGGAEGYSARLGRDGRWSYPPSDDSEREAWRAERRYTEAEALELARAAAPRMVTGLPEHPITIADMVAREHRDVRT